MKNEKKIVIIIIVIITMIASVCGERYTVCHALSCIEGGSWSRDTKVFTTYHTFLAYW